MTDPARWKRLEAILDQLLDLPETERAPKLDELTRGDPGLRREVEALLAEGDRPGGPLDRSFETFASPVMSDSPVESAEPEAIVGRRVGPYRVLSTLGRGGMGEVYLAERADGEFEHQVALKIVSARFRADGGVDRFRHERQILARLRHPNIAALYDGGATEDGVPYFAMERVEGEPITDYADRHRLGVHARVRLFESVCGAVAHAHRSLVVHRDLKPSNVLVTESGTVKLLDFGIAKLLDPEAETTGETTARFLTPAYASPEQIRGEPVTTATDVYSLGVLLYELLSGSHPHGSPARASELLRGVLEVDPPAPSSVVGRPLGGRAASDIAERRAADPATLRRALRGDLDNIVGKALEKNPDDRYGSAEDMRADLERFRALLPVSARAATAGYRLRKLVRRHRVAFGVGVTLAASVVVFAVTMSVLFARAEANLERAVRAEAEAAREAETANRVSDFLMGTFRVSNPNEKTWEELNARQILNRAAERIQTELTEEPLVRARLLGTIGDVYSGLARYEEARQMLEECVRIQRESGVAEPTYATSLNNYAILLQRTAAFPEAREVHREALAVRERVLGRDHAEVAQSLNNLAIVYKELGQTDSARVCYERALEIRQTVFGPDHENVASTAFNLGALCFAQEDYGRATELFERAHQIWSERLGPEHPRTVMSLGALAGVRRSTGDLDGAMEVQSRVVALQERALGPTHPEHANAVYNLALLQKARGDTAAAEGLMERALAVWEAALGPDHPQCAVGLSALAEIRLEEGRPELALPMGRRALEILERSRGPSDPRTAAGLQLLGAIERSLGHRAAAADLYERALAVLRDQLGEDDPQVNEAKAILAELGRAEP